MKRHFCLSSSMTLRYPSILSRSISLALLSNLIVFERERICREAGFDIERFKLRIEREARARGRGKDRRGGRRGKGEGGLRDFSHPRCSLLRRRASRLFLPKKVTRSLAQSHNRALKGDNTSTIATHTTSRPSPHSHSHSHSHPLHPISPSCPPHLILLSTSGKSRRSRQTKQRPLTRQTLPSRRRK